MQKIILSNKNGYLINSLKPYLNVIQDKKVFIHFGCPSNKKRFKSKLNLFIKSRLSTLLIIAFCKIFNYKLIYASSMGIFDLFQTFENLNKFDISKTSKNLNKSEKSEKLQYYYNLYKFKNELSIKKYLNNYLILRIPRVYSKTCKKGLLDPENTHFDYNKKLDFITLQEFQNCTLKNINLTGTLNYKTQTKTIKEILEIFKYS